MRRGLLSWDRDEVPEAVLEARIARFQAALRDAGLDAALVYTSFPRPAAVSYLTHFVPYWSQAVLAVLPDAPPVLVASLTKRVGGWILTTAHLGEVIHTPDPGRVAAELVRERVGPASRIGVVELSRLPGGISRALFAAAGDMSIEDASAPFRAIRERADAVEIALSQHAAGLAARALDEGVASGADDCGTLIAAIDRTARLAGAEEVQVLVAPDLARDAALERIEGRRGLGARYAVRVSLAHKGFWVRLGRSVARDGSSPPGWADARHRFDEALGDGGDLDVLRDAGFRRWCVEGCIGTVPLVKLAGGPAPGAIVTVSAETDSADGPMLASEPVLLAAERGGAARRLAPEPTL